MTQKFQFAILRIEVTRASRGLSAIAELLVDSHCSLVGHAIDEIIKKHYYFVYFVFCLFFVFRVILVQW